MRPKKGSKLLRKGRKSIPNQSYLLTTSTANREKIFHSADAAQIVLKSLQWLESQTLINLYATVVMPDHVHLIASLKDADLPQLMHRFKRFTARQANKILKRKSPLWQRGYHDHAIRRDEDLYEVVMYVLNNPVRAKLVDDFHDFPFWYCRWDV